MPIKIEKNMQLKRRGKYKYQEVYEAFEKMEVGDGFVYKYKNQPRSGVSSVMQGIAMVYRRNINKNFRIKTQLVDNKTVKVLRVS